MRGKAAKAAKAAMAARQKKTDWNFFGNLPVISIYFIFCNKKDIFLTTFYGLYNTE